MLFGEGVLVCSMFLRVLVILFFCGSVVVRVVFSSVFNIFKVVMCMCGNVMMSFGVIGDGGSFGMDVIGVLLYVSV